MPFPLFSDFVFTVRGYSPFLQKSSHMSFSSFRSSSSSSFPIESVPIYHKIFHSNQLHRMIKKRVDSVLLLLIYLSSFFNNSHVIIIDGVQLCADFIGDFEKKRDRLWPRNDAPPTFKRVSNVCEQWFALRTTLIKLIAKRDFPYKTS